MATVVKRTYVIPEDIIKVFEGYVPAGKRSAVLVELMSEWIEKRKLDTLRLNVIAGCLDMADVQLELERDFHPLEEEVAYAKKLKS